jgi:hypothetical protein
VIARAMASLAAALALAFVLPGSVLLRQYAQRRSDALPPNVEVSGTLSLWGDDVRAFAQRTGLPLAGDREDRLDIPAHLTLNPQRCVLELGSTDKPLGKVVDDGGRLQGADPSQASGLAGVTALVGGGCVPFLWRGAGGESGLTAFLQEHGGNPRDVSLTRFDGRVAYAIGGPADGGGKAAFVISQESLLPLRLLVRDTSLTDVHYGAYRPVGYPGFPGEISVIRDGAPLATLAVQLPAR